MGKYWTYQGENSIIIRRLRATEIGISLCIIGKMVACSFIVSVGSNETRSVFRSVALFQFSFCFLKFSEIINLMIS